MGENKKYGAILIDPPWSYGTWGGEDIVPTTGKVQPYKPMSIKELMALDVDAYAAKDCALFMWVVSYHMDTAIDLLRKWGFEQKSLGFVWAKTDEVAAHQGALFYDDMFGDEKRDHKLGMGYYVRQQVELCLLATKGNPKTKNNNTRQLVLEPRREHSRKPDCVYDRIEKLFDGPYLEMFARQKYSDDWDVWGNETSKFQSEKPRNVSRETYPDQPGYKNETTSKHAAERVKPRAGQIREIVMTSLKRAGPATAEQMADRLSLPFASVQPRFSELKEKGRVQDSGQRGTTRLGSKCIIWKAVDDE